MSLPEKRPIFADVALAVRDGHFSILDHPACFAQERRGINRTGNGVEYGTVGQAEVTGHIAALLLAVDDAESADLLVGRNEAAIQVIADLDVG